MAYATLAEAQAAWQTADANLQAAYADLAAKNAVIRGSFSGNASQQQSARTQANADRQAAVEAVDAARVARRDAAAEVIRLTKGG